MNVTFGNGECQITLKPKFKQHVTTYIKNYASETNKMMDISGLWGMVNLANKNYEAAVVSSMRRAKRNLSYVSFRIRIHNTGTQALEDYKLDFRVIGEVDSISKDNITDDIRALISTGQLTRPTTYLNEVDMSGELEPHSNILVGNNEFYSSDIFVKPAPNATNLDLEWRLLSKHFRKEGILKIIIETEIKYTTKQIDVNDPNDEKTVLGAFEDFIEFLDK